REVQALNDTFPTFNLKLRNSSSKNVTALSIEIRADGRPRISAIAHNRDAVPVIVAGGTYEYKRQFVSSAAQAGGGYTPETLPNQSLIIKAALFDDGTFEGDAGFAVRYRAFALGARTQLARLEASYRQALQSTEPETQAALDNLLRQFNALDTEVDARAFEKLLIDFPGNSVDRPLLKQGVELMMFETKKEAVKAVEEFRLKQSSANDTEALRAWLIASRDRYQKWHDRLSKL
ncbi:MAG TPA: hypothetical protein VEQ40_11740, partial [Pyrinomonadaceae bacterium]|nr:hypothetical protein [Pyrinomonadaceae bacterium]